MSVKRYGVIAAAAMALFVTTPVASADEYGYLEWLAEEGEDVSTYEIRQAAVEYGYAICNLYQVSQSDDHVLDFMMSRRTMTDDQIALYTLVSIRELCPHLEYLIR